MPRIGEVLIATGVIDAEQLAEALRAQVIWGGRLGTALVELDHLRLDELAVALGRQHALPAALAAHFERADRSLVLPAELAEELACVPLARAGARIVIASIAPLGVADTERVASALGIAGELVIASIAPELRVRYFLEHVYGIPRPPRFLRVRGATSRTFADMPELDEAEAPASDAVPIEPAIELPSAALAGVPEPSGPEQRRYVETLADLAAAGADRDAIANQVAPRLALASPSAPPRDPGDVAATLAAIARGTDRDELARLVLDAVARFEPAAHAALLLAVRGPTAISWTGFARDGARPPALAVPLDHPGLVPSVIARKQARRAASGDLGTIDFLLLAALGAREADLAIVPIAVADHVVAALALAVDAGEPLAAADAIALATGAALTRLMREARRAGDDVLARMDLQRARK